MIGKKAVLAVAASAAFGLVALHPVAASAHWGGGHGSHWGGHWGGHGHYHFYRPYVWHRPIIYARPVVYSAVRPIAVSAPAPCTCLSKEYTPEGAVVFKDRCTNEMAMNPPPAPPQQTGELTPPLQTK